MIADRVGRDAAARRWGRSSGHPLSPWRNTRSSLVATENFQRHDPAARFRAVCSHRVGRFRRHAIRTDLASGPSCAVALRQRPAGPHLFFYTVISAITLVVALIPDFTYIPTVGRVFNGEKTVLVVGRIFRRTLRFLPSRASRNRRCWFLR